MPMYAYACKQCGHAFDIQQSFSEDSLTICPECDGSLRKKFNSVGVVFKGSGFYRNDSRSGAVNADAGSSSSAPAASGSESATSSTGGAAAPKTDSSTTSSSSPSTAPAQP